MSNGRKEPGDGILCPICGGECNTVRDTRKRPGGYVWRLRRCDLCDTSVSTKETIYAVQNRRRRAPIKALIASELADVLDRLGEP